MLTNQGLPFLEDMILGNTLSGMLSEIIVKNIEKHCRTLIRNTRVGGHPDLLPRDRYPHGNELRATEGIEVKTSKQRGGWQGHNPEHVWVVVFRYIREEKNRPPEVRQPIEFVQILAAELQEEDWSLAERAETSRRTRTVSINERGTRKLRLNPVYQNPEYVAGRTRALREEYRVLTGAS